MVTRSGVVDLGVGYRRMFCLQKFIKLYTCDLDTFLYACYTSISFFKVKNIYKATKDTMHCFQRACSPHVGEP